MDHQGWRVPLLGCYVTRAQWIGIIAHFLVGFPNEMLDIKSLKSVGRLNCLLKKVW